MTRQADRRQLDDIARLSERDANTAYQPAKQRLRPDKRRPKRELDQRRAQLVAVGGPRRRRRCVTDRAADGSWPDVGVVYRAVEQDRKPPESGP
ncbi:hypothetical protein ACFS2C_09490 [Prauserella oleivorans]|uniref:Uncharacterized protein n=1 Tax=Prauserella oleivorans TaxID=1478153 RepID=A0ABW5W8R7_9PSEU